jgi:hypothetical protein
MHKRVAAVALAAGLFLVGCPAHQSTQARMQEAAQELDVNARFGRMEMAAEHVAPTAKEQFFERRKAWGNRVRVADYEVAGMRLAKGDEDAEMIVKIAWYRVDEGDLRQTTVRQKWHDFKGAWKLTEETRVDGDIGLLGERIQQVAAPASTGPRHAQFPTIRLGGPATQPNEELPGSAEPAPAPAPPTTPTNH